MRALLIPLALLLLATPALALQVTPPNVSIDAVRGINNNLTFMVRNNESFPIRNIMLDASIQDATLPTISELAPNTEIAYTLTINPQSTFSQTYYRKFIFDQMRPTVLDLTTREVNITSGGFSPQFINLSDGDTIMWYNRDTISHTVTSGEFDYNLTPASSTTRTITGVRNLQYSDRINNFGAWLYVLNRTQPRPVRIVDSDVPVTLAINAMWVDSYVEALIMEPAGGNATIYSNQELGGILQFKNPSNNLAMNITITSTDPGVTILRNNFNVTVGQTIYAPFSFKKQFNESNVTRTIVIDYRGANCRSGQLGLQLFIPPGAGTQLDNSTAEFFIQRKLFCDAFPTSPFCLTAPIIKEVNQTVFEKEKLPYVFTMEDVNTYFRRQADVNELLRQQQNFVKENLDLMRTQTETIKNRTDEVNNKLTTIAEAEETNRSRITIIYVIAGVAILISLAGGAMFWVYKRHDKSIEVGMG